MIRRSAYITCTVRHDLRATSGKAEREGFEPSRRPYTIRAIRKPLCRISQGLTDPSGTVAVQFRVGEF
jgi:hypothetical protein